ncbi:MAG: hypothetical protein M1831_001352 [Alyxoria varia]|nr:MAG: hypothetical protein M1831_001352 [Alyxoria varia]
MPNGGHQPRASEDGQKTKEESLLGDDLINGLPSVVNLRIPFGGSLPAPVDPPPLEIGSDAPRKSFFVIPPKVPDFVIKCENGERLVVDKEYHSKQDVYDRFYMEQLVDQWRDHFAKESRKYRPVEVSSEVFVEGRPSDYPHHIYQSPFSPGVPEFEQWRRQPLPPHPYYGAYIPPNVFPDRHGQRAPGLPPSQDLYGFDTSAPKGSHRIKHVEGTYANDPHDPQSVKRNSNGHSNLENKDEAGSAPARNWYNELKSQDAQQVDKNWSADTQTRESNAKKPTTKYSHAPSFHNSRTPQDWMAASAGAAARASKPETYTSQLDIRSPSAKSAGRQHESAMPSGLETVESGSVKQLGSLGMGVSKPPSEHPHEGVQGDVQMASLERAPGGSNLPANEPLSQQEIGLGDGLAKVGTGVWKPPTTGELSHQTGTRLRDSLAKVGENGWKPPATDGSFCQHEPGLRGGLAKVGAAVWQPPTTEADELRRRKPDHQKENHRSGTTSRQGPKSEDGATSAAAAGDTHHSGSIKSVADRSRSKSHSKRSKLSRHSLSWDKPPSSTTKNLWTAAQNIPPHTSVRRHHKGERYHWSGDEKAENRSHVSIGIPWSRMGLSRRESGRNSAQDKGDRTSSRHANGHESTSYIEERLLDRPPHEEADTPSYKASSSKSKKPSESRQRSRSATYSSSSSSSSCSSSSDIHNHHSIHRNASTFSRHKRPKQRKGSSSPHHSYAKRIEAFSSTSQGKHWKERKDSNPYPSTSRFTNASKTSKSERLQRVREQANSHNGGSGNSDDGKRNLAAEKEWAGRNTEVHAYESGRQVGDEVAGRDATTHHTDYPETTSDAGNDSVEDAWVAQLPQGSIHPLDSASQACSS